MPIDDLIRPRAFQQSIFSSYFLTVGRALAVAQHFENICRAVADFIDIKIAVYSKKTSPDSADFADIIERIQKRMLGKAVERLGGIQGMPTDLPSTLDSAKDARNRIAHDCTISVFHPLADESALWLSLESLLADIRAIAKADAIVCYLLFAMNEHESLYVSKDYEDSIVKWVFEEFEGEDFLL